MSVPEHKIPSGSHKKFKNENCAQQKEIVDKHHVMLVRGNKVRVGPRPVSQFSSESPAQLRPAGSSGVTLQVSGYDPGSLDETLKSKCQNPANEERKI